MASPKVPIQVLLVLFSLLWLKRWSLSLLSISKPSFDNPSLCISIVLGLFFASVLTPGNYSYYYYSANSTSDKFISVAVGNGQQ
ncbi:putative movement protein 2 [Pelargonium ringspot virus]|uniref:Putative movement protein 2 n=1 Tax=Pelargonium ringspot virus TaxID=167020 RepID=A0A0B4MJX6_9TOMB|nr:putative movement protein 2 [Pelargonium ringspot virus]AHZ59475.1 putative movement protein 2 [Pelargonium ringspot virus]UOF93297.1 movement protein 2 [Pelargonium ringspot virus]